MLKRRNIEARIVHQMIRWNVNTIAEFNASEGAPSILYKRNEFYIDRSANCEGVSRNSKVGKRHDFSHSSGN